MRVRDPVCGMEFPVEKALAETTHHDTTYYFCTEACRKQFAEDPERYAR